MDVLITGGAGFLGQRLARRLLSLPSLPDAQGVAQPIDRLWLLDLVQAPELADARVTGVAGDVGDPQLLQRLITERTGAVFHLAAIVSGQAERDFDLGLRINLDASRAVLQACRQLAKPPRVLFTSSVAVYGGALPAVVQDDTALDPRSSYGVQKAMAELLLADYSRKGFVDGRVARLPTISVRPGLPNQAASSFASGIIREPLRGLDSVCPVSAATRLWLLSPDRAIDGLLGLYQADAPQLAERRTVNLPGLSVTAQQMVDALRRVAGDAVADRVKWQPDAAIERIVGSWPAAWDTRRAQALGLVADPDFEAIVRAHIAQAQG